MFACVRMCCVRVSRFPITNFRNNRKKQTFKNRIRKDRSYDIWPRAGWLIADFASCTNLRLPALCGIWDYRVSKKHPRYLVKNCNRAEAAGYTAICLTVDSVRFGSREADWRNNFNGLPPGVTLANYPTQVAWFSVVFLLVLSFLVLFFPRLFYFHRIQDFKPLASIDGAWISLQPLVFQDRAATSHKNLSRYAEPVGRRECGRWGGG